MVREFIGIVERILSRKVRAFNSSIDTHHHVSVEVFHLEPITTENSADIPGSDPRGRLEQIYETLMAQ
jgi:hypothetical protein